MKDLVMRIVGELIIAYTDVEIFFIKLWKGVKRGLSKLAFWRG